MRLRSLWYTYGVQRIAQCLLLCLLAFAGVLWWQLDSLSDLIVYRLQEQRVQTLTQTVTNAAGDPVTVTTTRLDGESVSDFVARHYEAVAAAKAGGA